MMRRAACLAALVCSLVACGGDDDGGGSALTITKLIGPEGGTVELSGGGKVTIPAGALTETTSIKITKLALDDVAPVPNNLEAAGKPYAFEPHGQTFAQAVKIEVPFEDDATEVRPIKLDDEDDTTWTTIVGNEKNEPQKKLSIDTTSFSVILAARPDRNSGVITLPDGAIVEDAGVSGTGGVGGTGGVSGTGGTGGLGGVGGVGGGIDAGMDAAIATDAAVAIDAGVAVVVPFYPTNGAFWNDYVVNDGDGREAASDTACDPVNDGPTYDACIHAGEMRAMAVPGRSSCAGIVANDALGAFDWTCIERAGEAWVVSTLNAEMHLADLIDFAGDRFRDNSVSVDADGSTIATSAPAVWWSNPIRRITTGTTVAAVHDVMIVSAGSTGTISTNADKVAFVTEPGTSHNGALQLRGNFQWVEPRVTGYEISVTTGAFDVVRGLHVTGSTNNGFRSSAIRASLFEDITVTNNTGAFGAQFQVVGTTVRRVTTSSMPTYVSQGIIVGPATGTAPATTDSLFEDLADDGANLGIGIPNARGCTFRRLTSRNCGVLSNGNAAIATTNYCTTNSFEDLTVIDSAQNGINAYGFDSTYRRLRISNAAGNGLRVQDRGNRIEDVRIAHTGTAAGSSGTFGLSLNGGWNVVQNVHVSGVGPAAAFATGSTNMRLANLYATAGDTLLQVDVTSNGGGAVVQNATAVGARYQSSVLGSRGNAVDFNGAGTSFAGNVLALNAARGLNLYSTSASRTRLRNFVLVGNDVEAVAINTSNGATFDGVLRMGTDGTGPVCVVPASSTGLTDTCLNEAPSTAAVTWPHADTGIVLGPVTSDAANADEDALGQASYATTLDFLSVDALERGWGRTGAGSWPSTDQQGACVSGDTCQVFDYALLAADTTARNIAPLPTGNDVITIVDKVPSSDPATAADCDLHSPGSTFLAGSPNRCESTFLRDAVEILFDGSGDDDNLCESDETCLYSPNAGAYQGHGPLISAGTFTPGLLTGITLLRYTTNGR